MDRQAHARKLLARRAKTPSVSTFLLEAVHRKAPIAAVLLGGAGYLYMNGNVTAAVGIAGFWLGCFLRDLRWYVDLVRAWPVTCELVDWTKVENIAQGGDGP